MPVPETVRRTVRAVLKQKGISALVRAQVIPRLPSAAARALPDYIIIGGQKCGTTSLNAYLWQHPNVIGSLYKEVHYFDLHFAKGLNWYRAHFPLLTRLESETARRGAPVLTGESTPSYLLHPPVPQRMRETVPDVKIIALLRDPVGRAHSHYQQIVDWCEEPLSFEDAIAAEDERLPENPAALTNWDELHLWLTYSYLKRGLYAEQLQRWYAVFPREQILILSFSDLLRETSAICRQVTDFLGLPPFEMELFPKTASRPREKMLPETRERLREYFRPHNQRLYELVGRDFGWD